MKILKEYETFYDANLDKDSLESKGVVCYVSSKYSKRFSVSLKVELWVVLDFQYDDAVKYLSNRGYKIKSGLSVEEMEVLKKESRAKSYVFFNKIIFYALIVFFALILMFFIFYK